MIGTLIKSAGDLKKKKNTSWANIIFEYKLFSKEDKTKDGRRDMGECMLSRVLLFATSWTITHQALLSMEFSRQGYWSGLPFPPLADLPNPGTELEAPESPALVGGFFTTESPGKPLKRQSFSYVVFILCVYSITEPQRRLAKTDCWPGTQSF